MPDGVEQWAQGGGLVAIGGLIYYIGKLIIDALAERRESTKEQRADAHTTAHTRVTDRATENAILISTLRALHGENERLNARVASLESDLATRDQLIAALELRLRKAEDELRSVANELSALRTT